MLGLALGLTEAEFDALQEDDYRASPLFDERWYLDTPLETARERLAQRHMQAWGMTREQAEHRIATSDGLNAELVRHSARFADWRMVG